MAYTTIDDPSKHFHIQLYTGTGSSRSVTNDADGGDFQPDLVITTSRSNGYNRAMFDTSRGVQKELKTNSNAAQATLTTGLSAFDSDGFSFNGASYNTSSYTFVAWQWKANGGSTTTNDASATGVGRQDSVYQANTTAGFSISTRVGTGSAGASYAHGLGGKPDVIIQKEYDDTNDWYSYFRVMGDGTHWIMLESTNGAVDDANMWNDTAPTSTIFTVGNSGGSNGSGENYIAYCWRAIKGYSKFGKYTGNAGEPQGAFVYTGFKPSFVLFKAYSENGQGWCVMDNKRSPYNMMLSKLFLNTADAESSVSGDNNVDFVSNGFKIRTQDDGLNKSGVTFLYMAFAEAPFVNSEGVPCTAR